jgi:hypothetical protein
MKTIIKTNSEGIPFPGKEHAHVHVKSEAEKDLPEVNIKVDHLPSKGLAYSGKYPKVSYRPYTFGEIKKINQDKGLSAKNRLEMVLSGIDCSFDKLELTISDLLYVGLLRKISTIGSDINLTVSCAKCKKPINENIGGAKGLIEFEDIKAPSLPIEADFSNGKSYEFSPLTVKEYFDLLDESPDKLDEIAMMARQCKNHDFQETYEFFQGLMPIDRLLLEEIEKYLDHGLKPIKLKCKNKSSDSIICSHETSVELDGGQALLTPFRGDQESISNRIHFGKRMPHKSH